MLRHNNFGDELSDGRVARLLTGHKTRSVLDLDNIVNERELATAGERLAEYVKSTTPKGRLAS